MKKAIKQKIELYAAIKNLHLDIDKHQAVLHELALKNTTPEDVEYFNNAMLSLELLKDIVKHKETLTIGAN